MPKIYFNEGDKLVSQALKKLHAELLAEGIRDKQIALWLGCTSQNVGQLWKNCSFSYKQILIIKDRLQKFKERF